MKKFYSLDSYGYSYIPFEGKLHTHTDGKDYILFVGFDANSNLKGFRRRLYRGKYEDQYFFTFQGKKHSCELENGNTLLHLDSIPLD